MNTEYLEKLYGKDNRLEEFFSLVASQLLYGGKKYALKGAKSRESTDELFDIHGMTWLFGTIHKYCFRFSNLKRERDLLKIATYAYLVWLKRGFFCKASGVSEGLDTSLAIKEMFFPTFQSLVTDFSKHFSVKGEPIQVIANLMSMWSNGMWSDISEEAIFTVFLLSYSVWEAEGWKGEDQDINNEEKSKVG